MNLYVHTHYNNTLGVIIQQVASLSAERPETWPAAADVGESFHSIDVEIDDHEVLKAMWNQGSLQERQAIVDALPKIQVISIAGTIQ